MKERLDFIDQPNYMIKNISALKEIIVPRTWLTNYIIWLLILARKTFFLGWYWHRVSKRDIFYKEANNTTS